MRKYIVDFMFLLIGSLLGSFLMFISQIILARNFSVEDYGVFVTVSNLVNIIAVFIGFGVGDFLVKIFSAEGKSAYRWIKPSFKIFYLNMAISMLIVTSIVYFNTFSDSVNILLLLFIPNILLQGFLTLSNAVNQIEQDFLKNSLFNLSIYVVRFCSVLIAYLTTKNIIVVGISIFILSIISFYPFYKNISKFFSKKIKIPIENGESSLHSPTFGDSMKQVYPFGLMGIFYYAYYQSDILILSYLEGLEASAYYSAAFTVLSLLYLFPNLLFRRLFLTKIHVWANHNNEKLFSFYKRSNLTMLVLGILITCFIFIFSDPIITIIYGEKYTSSIVYLKLLSLCIVFRFIYAVSGTIMSTKNNIFLKIKIQGVTAMINIIANFFFIAAFGIKGAIYSTIICEFLLCIALLWGTQKYFQNIKKGIEI